MQQANYENRRRAKRIEVKIPVRISLKSSPEKIFACFILDISEGGAFVHGTAPILIGEEVDVEILFEGNQKFEAVATDYQSLLEKLKLADSTPAALPSVVRWARGTSNAGFGIEFLNLSGEKLAFLHRLISHFAAKDE